MSFLFRFGSEQSLSDLWAPMAVIAAAFLTFGGVCITLFFNARVKHREFHRETYRYRLDQLSKQVDEFYGPLVAMDRTGEVLWRAFCKQEGRSAKHFFERDADENLSAPEPRQLRQFVHVMRAVFGPINAKRQSIILDNASLIRWNRTTASRGENVLLPKELEAIVAHTYEFVSIERGWKKGSKWIKDGESWQSDKKRMFYPTLPYPSELFVDDDIDSECDPSEDYRLAKADVAIYYLRYCFFWLKFEQQALIDALSKNDFSQTVSDIRLQAQRQAGEEVPQYAMTTKSEGTEEKPTTGLGVRLQAAWAGFLRPHDHLAAGINQSRDAQRVTECDNGQLDDMASGSTLQDDENSAST